MDVGGARLAGQDAEDARPGAEVDDDVAGPDDLLDRATEEVEAGRESAR